MRQGYLYTALAKFSIVIHMVLGLVACKSGHRQDTARVFRYNEDAGLSTLDPAFARDEAINRVVGQLYNGLVQLDTALNVIPAIAHRWEIKDSGKTYTFYLRSDVYFHSNKCFTNEKSRRVTAHDFAYSFNRIIDPKTASTGAWIFNDKVEQSFTKQQVNSSFIAESDSVFTIRLIKSFPPFLAMLAMPYCYVVPKEAIDMYGKDFRTNPVGTGPFKFRLWEEGVKLVLEKNPNYFEKDANGKQLPYIDAVEVGFIENKQTAFMEFVQGKIDYFDGLDGSYKDELLTKDGHLKPNYADRFRLEVNPFLNTEYLAFLQDTTPNNGPETPWMKPGVRQAINYAIDKDKLVLFLRNNIGIAGNNGFVPPGLPSFSEKVEGYTYNLPKAKELLAKEGYPLGQGLPPLTLSTTTTYQDMAIFVQKQLAEIGIKVNIEVNPGPAHRTQVSKGNLAFFRGSWIADYPDAENYLSLFYSNNKAPNGPNYSRYDNKEADKLYELALNQTNDRSRYAIYRQIDQLVTQDAPVVVLFYGESLRMVQPWVKGLKNSAMNSLVLKNIDIVKH